MNGAAPSDVIIVAGVFITGSTVARRTHRKQGEIVGTVVYGFLLTLVLLLIAVPAPTFAKALAYMGMVGAVAVNGKDVFGLIGDMTK